MQWCLRAWYSIPPEIITNCFQTLSNLPWGPPRWWGSGSYWRSKWFNSNPVSQSPHKSWKFYKSTRSRFRAPEEEEDSDTLDDDDPPTAPSNNVKLEAIRTVIDLLNEIPYDHSYNIAHRVLRSLQRDIRLQISSTKIQTTLDSFVWKKEFWAKSRLGIINYNSVNIFC